MRRYANNERANLADVSIHASVKDATYTESQKSKLISVSIHASVKDATMPMMFPIQTKMFQSTHL